MRANIIWLIKDSIIPILISIGIFLVLSAIIYFGSIYAPHLTLIVIGIGMVLLVVSTFIYNSINTNTLKESENNDA